MATIRVVSTSGPNTTRRDECIVKLADIQSNFYIRISELNGINEDDENFIQKCNELGNYIDYYDDELKDCYEDDFSYIYETIKQMLRNDLTKSTKYVKCIRNVTSQLKEQIETTKETRELRREKGLKDVIIEMETEVEHILESSKKTLDKEQLERQVLPNPDQKNPDERGTTDKQDALDHPKSIASPPDIVDPSPKSPEMKVPSVAAHKTEDTVAAGASTLGDSESVRTNSQESTPLQDTASTVSEQKDKFSVDGLDNGEGKPGQSLTHTIERTIHEQDGSSEQGSRQKEQGPLAHGSHDERATSGLPEVPKANEQLGAKLSLVMQPSHQKSELSLQQHRDQPLAHHTTKGGVIYDSTNPDENAANSGILKSAETPSEETTRNNGITTTKVTHSGGENSNAGDINSSTPETEPGIISLKMYIIIGLSILGILLLLIFLCRFTSLGSHFSKKKKKKRQEIQEELERMMYSPSNFTDDNMYLSYAYLENS
ncbi:PIR protein [Plasmodium ovale]|uniref:PIR protein n=1 Tax=Plasmodium ovale TaxID=36330 RepID=A0A1C3KJX3_PLAOA|nr:PIR protein [Plasmodium ovale]